MGKTTEIAWAHASFNGWRGCSKVSEACRSCYAEVWAKRTGKKIWGKDAAREIGSPSYWMQPHRWDIEAKREGVRRRVFCSSLADVFEGRSDLDIHRSRLWDLIETTSALDWLLLTKRPENIRSMVPASWLKCPRPNVWYGTTVENQEWAEKRIPHLLKVPAAVRFLSCEPLLGPVELGPAMQTEDAFYKSGISWIIVGGESGHHARPMHPDWARDLRDEAVARGIPYFFKQWGNWAPHLGEIVDLEKLALFNHAENGDVPVYLKDLEPDRRENWAEYQTSDDVYMHRTSVKEAGRLLDGQLWDQVPQRKTKNTTRNEVTS